jgi:hypothetical protein
MESMSASDSAHIESVPEHASSCPQRTANESVLIEPVAEQAKGHPQEIPSEFAPKELAPEHAASHHQRHSIVKKSASFSEDTREPLLSPQLRTDISWVSSSSPRSTPRGRSPSKRRSSLPEAVSRRANEMTCTLSSVGEIDQAMNQTLKLFITHFFVLYMFQVCMQLLVILIDYSSEKQYIDLGVHSLAFLAAADLFIVFLFLVELGVQIVVQSFEKWIKNWWHKFDMFVLIISILLVTIDIAQVFAFPCHISRETVDGSWEGDFELCRDVLRLVRIALFLQQLQELLNSPLEHFALLAEDMNDQAEEINDYI